MAPKATRKAVDAGTAPEAKRRKAESAAPAAPKGAAARAGKAAKEPKGQRAPEQVYVGSGPLLEGIVSAWYNADGFTGQHYGFIERSLRPGAKSMGVLEHHQFVKEDIDRLCLPEVRKGLTVQFRSAGRDTCGRWRGVEVCLATEQGVDQKTPAANLGQLLVGAVGGATTKIGKQASGAVAAGAAVPAAAAPTMWDITRELVLKAWKKLGGEATWREVVHKLKTDKKLSERVAAQLGGTRENSGDEVWEELVPKIMKAEGESTSEKRAMEGGASAKVLRLREA